jgi:hypothetical protein
VFARIKGFGLIRLSIHEITLGGDDEGRASSSAAQKPSNSCLRKVLISLARFSAIRHAHKQMSLLKKSARNRFYLR